MQLLATLLPVFCLNGRLPNSLSRNNGVVVGQHRVAKATWHEAPRQTEGKQGSPLGNFHPLRSEVRGPC